MIRKKRRRNPYINNFFIQLLEEAISGGDPSSLTDAITYYKQGPKCADCDREYFSCKCEECPECKFARCLCDLGIKKQHKYSDYSDEDFDKVSERTKQFAYEVLNKDQINELNKRIKKSFEIL